MELLKKMTGFFKPARPEKELGRNDSCWCGSGRKYKHCHLEKDRHRERSRVRTCTTS